MSSYPNVVAVDPAVAVSLVPAARVPVVAAPPVVATAVAQPDVPVTVAEIQVGVVSIGEVVISGGAGGGCPPCGEIFKVLFTNAGDVLLLNDGRIAVGRY